MEEFEGFRDTPIRNDMEKEYHYHHDEEDRHKHDVPSYNVYPDPETGQAKLNLRMLCFIVIALIVMLLTIGIMNSTLRQYKFYAKDSGFPGANIMFVMTLFTYVMISYATYVCTTGKGKKYQRTAFWLWIVFFVFYVFWIINLSLRIEYYSSGVVINSNGTLYLLGALFCVCGLLLIAACNKSYTAVLYGIIIAWMMYLVYSWWYKITPLDKRQVGECTNPKYRRKFRKSYEY